MTDSELVQRLRSREPSPDIMFRMSDVLLLREAAEAIERYESALGQCEYSFERISVTGNDGVVSIAASEISAIRQALQPGKVKAE